MCNAILPELLVMFALKLPEFMGFQGGVVVFRTGTESNPPHTLERAPACSTCATTIKAGHQHPSAPLSLCCRFPNSAAVSLDANLSVSYQAQPPSQHVRPSHAFASSAGTVPLLFNMFPLSA